jgi:hypothetical protein
MCNDTFVRQRFQNNTHHKRASMRRRLFVLSHSPPDILSVLEVTHGLLQCGDHIFHILIAHAVKHGQADQPFVG